MGWGGCLLLSPVLMPQAAAIFRNGSSGWLLLQSNLAWSMRGPQQSEAAGPGYSGAIELAGGPRALLVLSWVRSRKSSRR